jgi:hypothetical protein
MSSHNEEVTDVVVEETVEEEEGSKRAGAIRIAIVDRGRD